MEVVKCFNVLAVLLVSLIWLAIIIFLWLKKKKSLVYLLMFTIFYIYLIKVFDYTVFQFQSLLLLKNFVTGLMLNGQAVGENINLIPLLTLTSADQKTSFLNILLLVPFGFGLPFLTNFRMKMVVMIGAFFSVIIEFLQLITGLIAGSTFRIVDINDLLFNTLGVVIGYILFTVFLRIYQYIAHNVKPSVNK